MVVGGRKSRATAALAAFTAALVLLAMPRCGLGDITCDQVNFTLRGCVGYVLIGWGPSRGCCNGVRSVVAAAQTTQDRRTICSCVKSEAGGYSDGVIRRAIGIPGKCGVSLAFQFSPSIDCDTIS